MGLIVLAGCSAPTADGAPSGGDATATGSPGLAADPPDPPSDRLGWESGRWYNESIAIDVSDGLAEAERRRLVTRTMARVERIRRLEFERRVQVEVVNRTELASRIGTEAPPPAVRRLENAKYEALFMVNESANAVAIQRGTSESAVAGFYSSRNGRIVIVTPAGAPARIDELTLAHELTHALQDQHFDLGSFARPTREQHNAVDGIVEGDPQYVQHRYEQRCMGAWNGSCVSPTAPTGGGEGGSTAGLGPFLVRYQPYSDGPVFVRSLHRSGGWEAVNAAYDDPPASTEQTIHPRLYGRDAPTRVTVADRSGPGWRRLDVPGQGPDYAALGEAGMASMLVYPALATGGESSVVPARSFLSGGGFDPYNYSNRYTAGWDGDRLVVYVNDSTPRNETGYVWATAWDSPAQAAAFVEGYRALLRLHGAERVPGRPNAWTIPDDREFADAFRIERSGDRVVIVNAPTVEGLSGVREPAVSGPTPG